MATAMREFRSERSLRTMIEFFERQLSLRPIEFTPPVPGFNGAIITAIRQWRFEPPFVKGEPASYCMRVASIIHWWE